MQSCNFPRTHLKSPKPLSCHLFLSLSCCFPCILCLPHPSCGSLLSPPHPSLPCPPLPVLRPWSPLSAVLLLELLPFLILRPRVGGRHYAVFVLEARAFVLFLGGRWVALTWPFLCGVGGSAQQGAPCRAKCCFSVRSSGVFPWAAKGLCKFQIFRVL